MDREIDLAVAAYMALGADEAAWARKAVAPYESMTPDERLRALAALNGWVDTMLAGRVPSREDGEIPFWKLWKDPTLGGRTRRPS